MSERTSRFVILEHAMEIYPRCTFGRMYKATEDDGEGVFFEDDIGLRQYVFDKNLCFVSKVETVQNPDEDVPVCPAPNPAIDHPAHYNQGGIECISAIRASMSLEAFRGFLKGNQLKYLWRYESKGKAAEDIGKSNWYGAELEKSLKA